MYVHLISYYKKLVFIISLSFGADILISFLLTVINNFNFSLRSRGKIFVWSLQINQITRNTKAYKQYSKC